MGKPKGSSRGLSYLQRVRPDAVTHLLAFFRESGRHLDPKTRVLISVVTKVITGSPRGVAQYVKKALRDGATPDEIIDAVLCSYPCAGLTKVVDALDVILDLGLPGFDDAARDAVESAASTGAADAEASKVTAAEASPPDDPLSQRILDEVPDGWYEAGTTEELGDDRRLRVLAGPHDVAVFEVDGKVYAIGNRCPHAGAPLSEGRVHGCEVSCPLHAWRFHLETGQSTDVPGASVPTYDVKVESGRVYLRFDRPNS